MSVLKKSELVFAPLSSNGNFKDLSGKKFDRLSVLGYTGRVNGRTYWYCECECGEITMSLSSLLILGKTRSCGCLHREYLDSQVVPGMKNGRRTKDGKVSPEYRAFNHAKARCQCKTDHKYPDYGGRGIKFLFNSFEEFLSCMGRRPSSRHSVDRIDVNGHYSPVNCRWATPRQQSINQRSNVTVSIDGEEYVFASFFSEDQKGLYKKAYQRLRGGWPAKSAIFGHIPPCTHPKSRRKYAKKSINGKSLEELANATGLVVPTPVGKASPSRKIGGIKDAA